VLPVRPAPTVRSQKRPGARWTSEVSTASPRYGVAINLRTASSGIGSIALGFDVIAWGDYATAVGGNARATGNRASAIGEQSVASGDFSTAHGTLVTASGHYSTVMGHRASTNGMAGAFVYGDQSTLNYVTATRDHEFVVRASGGVTLYSDALLTSGAYLSPGGGSWQSVSDVRKKTAFRELPGEDVLSKLRAMPVRSWQYKSQDASIRHIGPTAQLRKELATLRQLVVAIFNGSAIPVARTSRKRVSR